jgi:hypothetical protein
MAVCGRSVRADWPFVNLDGARVEDGKSDRFTDGDNIDFIYDVRYVFLRWFFERYIQNRMDEFAGEHREIQRSRFRRLRVVRDGKLVVLFAELSVTVQRRVSLGIGCANNGVIFAPFSTHHRGEAKECKYNYRE